MSKLKNTIAKMAISFIYFLCEKLKLDLIVLAYKNNGFMKSESHLSSGEDHFIKTFLTQKIKTEIPIFFDIGANVGMYSQLLRQSFPGATIFAFEPSPPTYQELLKNLTGKKVNCVNIGFSKTAGKEQLYTFVDNHISVNATLDPLILQEISHRFDLTNFGIELDTVDEYCSRNGIQKIHMLKIDTEGFEIEVLKGAKSMLNNCQIDMIQFEFNEVNIIKRVFLKDFYNLLPHYTMYRLNTKSLIPLGPYRPIYEIFQFQNIVAIRN